MKIFLNLCLPQLTHYRPKNQNQNGEKSKSLNALFVVGTLRQYEAKKTDIFGQCVTNAE